MDPGGCAFLDPNPDSFETGVFPTPPWSTSGDDGLGWAITMSKAEDGMFSIESPDFESVARPGVGYASNATLDVCPGYPGGQVRLQVYPSVVPPFDILLIYIDGEVGPQLADVHEWTELIIDLGPSEDGHRIDFSYQYNRFMVQDLPPLPARREGELVCALVGDVDAGLRASAPLDRDRPF